MASIPYLKNIRMQGKIITFLKLVEFYSDCNFIFLKKQWRLSEASLLTFELGVKKVAKYDHKFTDIDISYALHSFLDIYWLQAVNVWHYYLF